MTGPGRGPQGVYDQINGPGPQAPPPNSGLIQGAAASSPPPPPPNYGELGSGQAKADFAAASANGGWEFDPAAMDKVIKALQDSLDNDYSRANVEATFLTGIDAMGKEVGSEGYVAKANASGAAYQEFLRSAVDYTTAYVDTLRQIRDAYQRQDQAALDAIRDVGKAV
ncbi:hypothetical protein DMH03_05235 [Amycolatopsis sp. WAC 01376]|uniref:hypothetical protein n=1 Tax=Amycolatopsis sp. WAC 01376 TaxID=2203195 RepID=UPI000F785627|nr:hypothetical protein [Amycolatopsis sp. WAC 01376]RSM66512.1 hypothetical protein DMH03_05235 [Amycolatopsis sp. WAC 01376]